MYISEPVHKQNKICMNIKFLPKRGWVYLQSATYKVKDINISKEFSVCGNDLNEFQLCQNACEYHGYRCK